MVLAFRGRAHPSAGEGSARLLAAPMYSHSSNVTRLRHRPVWVSPAQKTSSRSRSRETSGGLCLRPPRQSVAEGDQFRTAVCNMARALSGWLDGCLAVPHTHSFSPLSLGVCMSGYQSVRLSRPNN